MIKNSQHTLRDRQSLALRQMLHFGQPLTRKDTIYEPEWKVLVYDDAGKNIISPILSVKQLHEVGVTLYMGLHSERDEISDTPVIYLCEPSPKNIQRISEDLRKNMYQEYYFNFVSPIARQELEALASVAVESNTSSNIKKVFDQHLSFISLENDLFALKHLKMGKTATKNSTAK